MKSLKIFLVSLSVTFSVCATAQEPDTKDSYYDYELVATTEVINGIDTVYRVYLTLDTLDIKKYKKLTVLEGAKEKILSVKPEDISTDPRFELIGNEYRINVGEWAGIMNWIVIGKKYDDSEKELEYKKEKDKVKHVVIKKPKTWDLEIVTDKTVPAEEI